MICLQGPEIEGDRFMTERSLVRIQPSPDEPPIGTRADIDEFAGTGGRKLTEVHPIDLLPA